MKEKKLPSWIKNKQLYGFFQSKPGRIFSNWVLQGMLYMNRAEILYKASLDLAMVFIIWLVFFRGSHPGFVIVAFLFAHTINWLINCQPIALIRHLDWGKNDPHKFIRFIEAMHERIQHKSYLAGSAAYGSLSIGNYKPTSDIDIRVIMRPGFLNMLRAVNFCFIERVRAAIDRFPLDLYAFTMEETLVKMNPKEPPIIFSDPDGMLTRAYPEIVTYDNFRNMFRDRLSNGDYD